VTEDGYNLSKVACIRYVQPLILKDYNYRNTIY